MAVFSRAGESTVAATVGDIYIFVLLVLEDGDQNQVNKTPDHQPPFQG